MLGNILASILIALLDKWGRALAMAIVDWVNKNEKFKTVQKKREDIILQAKSKIMEATTNKELSEEERLQKQDEQFSEMLEIMRGMP